MTIEFRDTGLIEVDGKPMGLANMMRFHAGLASETEAAFRKFLVEKDLRHQEALEELKVMAADTLKDMVAEAQYRIEHAHSLPTPPTDRPATLTGRLQAWWSRNTPL